LSFLEKSRICRTWKPFSSIPLYHYISMYHMNHKSKYYISLYHMNHKSKYYISMYQMNHKSKYYISMYHMNHKSKYYISMYHMNHKSKYYISLYHMNHKSKYYIFKGTGHENLNPPVLFLFYIFLKPLWYLSSLRMQINRIFIRLFRYKNIINTS